MRIECELIPKLQSLPQAIKNKFLESDLPLLYVDQLLIVDGGNCIRGYAPTQEDLFATDWMILD